MKKRAFGSTGETVAVVGQGTWQVGDDASKREQEIEALQTGLDQGLTHIDTAEMYGRGRAEDLVGEAIRGRRQEVFLTSKVLPENASYDGTLRACERSLERLGTDYLDLYLLHWPSRHPLAETMRALETLVDRGLTRYIGVSNFDVAGLEEAQGCLRNHPLSANQVLYYLQERGIEHELLPYCQERGIAVVAYSPFGQGDFPAPGTRQRQVLDQVGQQHDRSAHQVALNFLVSRGVFAIPKAANPAHVRDNAAATGWELTAGEQAQLEKTFPLPPAGRPLATL